MQGKLTVSLLSFSLPSQDVAIHCLNMVKVVGTNLYCGINVWDRNINETSLNQKLSTDIYNFIYKLASFETGYCVLNSFFYENGHSAIFLSC